MPYRKRDQVEAKLGKLEKVLPALYIKHNGSAMKIRAEIEAETGITVTTKGLNDWYGEIDCKPHKVLQCTKVGSR